MTSETSRQVEGVVSAIATQSAISGDAAFEAALEPCVLPDGRTAIVLGKGLEDAVRNAAIRHREQPAPDIMSTTLEQAIAHLDPVFLTIWRMSEAPHLNGGKTKRIDTDLAHATRVLYGLRETLRKARREWDVLDEAERLVGPDSAHDEEAGEPDAPTQRWDNVWTEDAWLAAHPGKMPPDVDRLKVTCAARLYERASTDVDAGKSTHAACKRAIEACENDERWSIGDRDGAVFVESIERIGEEDEARRTVEVPAEFREAPRVEPRKAPHTAVAFTIVDRRLGARWPGPGDETEGTGALDVRACIDKELTLAPGESAVVSAGFTIDAGAHEVVLAPHPARTADEKLRLAFVIGGVGFNDGLHISARKNKRCTTMNDTAAQRWSYKDHRTTIVAGLGAVTVIGLVAGTAAVGMDWNSQGKARSHWQWE